MDKELVNLLLNLKFDIDEIEHLKEMSPNIDNISLDDALLNIKTVIEFGYPEADIVFLISQNPDFMSRDSKDLYDSLSAIAKIENIEEALKNNPFLI